MRKLTQNVNLLRGFALIAMLSGCQNEELITQQSQSDITVSERNAKIIFTPQLLKEGANELEYYGDYSVNRGKLKKVSNAIEGVYVEYQYNGQTIVAQKKKIATNALIYQVTYQLDGAGNCIESHSTETNKVWKYEYGQPGRLTKVFYQTNPNERMEFGYVQGSVAVLKDINFFNQANAKISETSYSYMTQGGSSTTENKCPGNPDALGYTSKYLPIFGTLLSYLPTYEVSKNTSTGQIISANSLAYVLNASGYVKTVTATSDMTQYVTTINRTYTTPKL